MRRPRRSPRTAPPPPAPAETRSPSPPRRARPRSATSATLSRGLQQLEARHRARRGRRTCGVLEPGVHIMVLAVRAFVPAGSLPAPLGVSVVGLLHHPPPEFLDHLLDLPAVEHLQPAQLPGTPVGDRQQQPATAYQDAPQLPNRPGEVALIRFPVVATSRVESAACADRMRPPGET